MPLPVTLILEVIFMLIKTKKDWEISENKTTDEWIYLNRRHLLQIGGASVLMSTLFNDWSWAKSLKYTTNSAFKVEDKDRELTQEKFATGYNNFYEFSLDKDEVKNKVEKWNLSSSWNIEISGIKDKTKIYDVNDLVKLAGGLEERVYRFRCVEAWSMVIPWIGFSLANLLKKLNIDTKAKYIQFQTFSDKKIGTNMSNLPQYPWPYTEALTLEEAMNPLTMLVTGMYGKDLPKQNGAPIRLIVPWKYGYKSIKSIQKISFVEKRPNTLWESLASNEYGFYANVNPKRSHPRWTQETERLINGSFLPKRIPTLMFNGYEKEVASLYKGMDLIKNY
jgi:sulfoxide reductase catalytic subunit YedY